MAHDRKDLDSREEAKITYFDFDRGEVDQRKEFRGQWPITRDLFAYKKRGVWLERAYRWIAQNFWDDPEIQLFVTPARGMPTVILGVTSLEKLAEVLDGARQAGVLRESLKGRKMQVGSGTRLTWWRGGDS